MNFNDELSSQDFEQLMNAVENPEYNEKLANFLKDVEEQNLEIIDPMLHSLQYNSGSLQNQLSKANEKLDKIRKLVSSDCQDLKDLQKFCDEILSILTN